MTDSGVSLEQLLGYVERAVKGDRRLLVQLFRTMQQLASHPTAPPQDRILGQVLSQVLMGDRTPDLTGLPDDVAAEVQELLSRLKRS